MSLAASTQRGFFGSVPTTCIDISTETHMRALAVCHCPSNSGSRLRSSYTLLGFTPATDAAISTLVNDAAPRRIPRT
jgi:hypothetical protein